MTLGATLSLGETVSGSMQIQSTFTAPSVGFATMAAADTEHGPVMLQLGID